MSFWKIACNRVRLVLGNDRGQGLVEYALVLVLIAIAVFAMVQTMGGQLNTTYEKINTSVENAVK